MSGSISIWTNKFSSVAEMELKVGEQAETLEVGSDCGNEYAKECVVAGIRLPCFFLSWLFLCSISSKRRSGTHVLQTYRNLSGCSRRYSNFASSEAFRCFGIFLSAKNNLNQITNNYIKHLQILYMNSFFASNVYNAKVMYLWNASLINKTLF